MLLVNVKGKGHHTTCQWRQGGKSRVQIYPCLTSVPDDDGWSTPCLGCFIAGKGALYPLNRRLGGP